MEPELGCRICQPSDRAAGSDPRPPGPLAYAAWVRLTEFWQRMEARFGTSYAHSVATDYRLPTLGSTIEEALRAGVETKQIWRAVCAEFDIPGQLR